MLPPMHREFVNSVWYIKILSPDEFQQMGKESLEDIPNYAQNHKRSDDFVSRKDSRSGLNGMPSVCSLDY